MVKCKVANGYGFKFFLWDKIEPYYRKDARPDRISQYTMAWSTTGLKSVLQKRLKAFSNEKISSINKLLTKTAEINADDAICIMANGSPRNMIRFCENILALQAERNQESKTIDFQALDQASVVFSENLCRELYGEEQMKSMQKVGRELFTINFVASDVLKITGQAVRNKITAWVNSGLVKQVGTIVVPPAKKPVNFYCVIDPIAVRLIHRTVSFDSFIKDRWLPCDHCNTDNLLNIDLYPDENEAVCRDCGRELI